MTAHGGWGPLQAATIDFSDAAVPAAPAFGDVYHARAGALAQARHVFLAGNGLPARWAGRADFCVLETGFGLGNNFLATWQTWRDDPARPSRLHYVAVEKHPPRAADLARAHAATALPALAQALVAAWPPLTPDLHPISLDGGRVRLLLAFGDIAQVLPALQLQADAIYLDGFAPDRNPQMWHAPLLQRLARLAAPGATATTWSVAAAVRQGLAAAGFTVHKHPGFGGKREMTVAQFSPRHRPTPPPGRQAQPGVQRVAVVGAGLAGAAAARALAAAGLQVQVIERQPGCAQETSGNPAGLFHGVVHAHDGAHARWLRAAALQAQRVIGPLVCAGQVPGAAQGLLRGERSLDAAAMQALVDGLGLPADYLQIATTHRSRPAWFYPGGGWVAPAALCEAWLRGDGGATTPATPTTLALPATAGHGAIGCHWGRRVDRLQPADAAWHLLDGNGHTIAEADAVVLCNAADAARLLADWPAGPAWPLGQVRGQVSWLEAEQLQPLHGAAPPLLPHPLAEAGYVLRMHAGPSRPPGQVLAPSPGGASSPRTEDPAPLLFGATSQPGDLDPAVREADHAHNLAVLQRLSGWSPPPGTPLQGRTGWRLVADDRLPLLGAVPDGPALATARRTEQPRQVPRRPGLYVLTALGSRGITQAALAGEVLAAWITGQPLPVPLPLLDALDVARFASRARRRAAHDGD